MTTEFMEIMTGFYIDSLLEIKIALADTRSKYPELLEPSDGV